MSATLALPHVLLMGFVLFLGAAGSVYAQETPGTPPEPPPQAPGYLQEPPIVGQAIEYAGDKLSPSPGMPGDGFYPEFGYMITGSGWISAGPGYHHKFADSRGLADASAAISWRAYKIAQARVEYHAIGGDTLTVGAQGIWQDLTQVHFYGIGADSLKSNGSAYRMKDVDTIAWVRYNLHRLVLGATLGYLDRPTISSPTGPFHAGFEDARQLFGAAGAPGLVDPASFLHADFSVAADSRDDAEHATRGGMYRADMSIYSDRDSGQYSFQRYQLEGVQYLPIVPTHNWVLALHGWLVGSDSADGKAIPIYMLPSLGGHNTLRGYEDYRFHDRNMLLASVESRWAAWEHLDTVLFLDTGSVAPRLSDLDLSKTSIGVGLRVHTRRATFGRLDLGHSKEGWRLVFKMDDPFALHRLSRRLAWAPFVP